MKWSHSNLLNFATSFSFHYTCICILNLAKGEKGLIRLYSDKQADLSLNFNMLLESLTTPDMWNMQKYISYFSMKTYIVVLIRSALARRF